jgi:hypothetical protein
MAAGLGFKTFNTGDVLSAADTNGYLMQGVLVFANATARDAAITSPQEGQFAFTKDNDSLWYYSGSAWVSSGATGDIEGVTAGTGISGGGTSGTVTVTNSMATAIDAKGDLIVGTGADTFARLGVGTNGHTIVADSAETTGLKWAAPASGGMTLLQSLSLSGGTSVTSSTLSSAYKQFVIYIRDFYGSGMDACNMRLNGDTGSNYNFNYMEGATTYGGTATNAGTSIRIGTVTNASTTRQKNHSIITIMRPSDTDQVYVFVNGTQYHTSLSTQYGNYTVGVYDSSAALTSITIFSTATLTAGTAEIYGVN